MIISNMVLVLCLYILFNHIFLNHPYIRVLSFNGKIYGLNKIYLCIMMFFLFVLSGIRGDFATDYVNYNWSYQNVYSAETIIELLRRREFGFAFINKIAFFINSNTVTLMLIISALTTFCYYIMFEKYSEDYLVSLIMLVVLDNYVISFNLTRNILACAFFLLSSELIINKKLLQYLICVLLITTIHKSAILMLPMYWILKFDFRIKKHQIFPLLCIVGGIIFMLFFNEIVFFTQRLIGYDWEKNGYGIGRGSIGSLMKTLFLFAIVLVLSRKSDYMNMKERIWFNGCIFNVLFQFCSFRLFMMQRIGFYFSGFFLLLIPFLLSKKKDKERKLWRYAIVSFCILYAFLFRKDIIYYTFWNNKII